MSDWRFDFLTWLARRTRQRFAQWCLVVSICSAALFANASCCKATAKYWDTNGATAGAGGSTPNGTWSAAPGITMWNESADGTGPSVAWSAGNDAVFAAGSDATGAYEVTLFGNPSVANVSVEEGAVSISGAGVGSNTLDFGPSTGTVHVATGSTLTETSSVVLAGTGGLTKTGAGTLLLRGTNTFAVGGTGSNPFLTINEGVVDFTSDLNLGTVPTTADNAAALTIDGGTLRYAGSVELTLASKRGVTIGPSGATIDVPNAVNFALPSGAPTAAALSGSGTITKTGTGRFSLNTAQTTFTGKYVVSGGSLSFTSEEQFGAVPTTTQPDYFTLDGGALRLGASTGLSIDSKRGITLGPNGGTLIGREEGLLFNGTIAGVPGAGITVSAHDAVPDPEKLWNVYFGSVNTYDGVTKIEAGARLTVVKVFNGSIDSGLGRSSSAASNLILDGGILTCSSSTAISTDRNFTVTQLGAQIDSSASNGSPLVFTSTDPISMTGVGPRTLTLSGSSHGGVGGNVFAPAITDQGPNPTTFRVANVTWLLTNTNNSYSGNTIVSGKLKLGAAGVIPDGSLLRVSGVFDLNGFDETVGSIYDTFNSTSGSVLLGAKKLTFSAPNNEVYPGMISGLGGSIIKAGNGKLTLSRTNTYTGDTVIQAGTLQIDKAYLANGADVRMASGALLNLNFVGTDVIDSLYIDGLAQAVGTWGAVGSGATHQSAMFGGTGLLQVTNFYAPNSGDFNADGDVDAADYVTWRRHIGSNDPLPNSNGLSTPIGQAHYNLWRASVGNASAGSGLGAEGAVPEASSIVLALICLCAFSVRRGCTSLSLRA